MYSVKEAAQKLGLDTSQVRRLLAKGKIKGKKLARDWIVLEVTYTRKRKPKVAKPKNVVKQKSSQNEARKGKRQ